MSNEVFVLHYNFAGVSFSYDATRGQFLTPKEVSAIDKGDEYKSPRSDYTDSKKVRQVIISNLNTVITVINKETNTSEISNEQKIQIITSRYNWT